MVTNFLFFGSLNGFVLLPLYVSRLGGTEAEIGVVQAMYSAAGIVCQPLVGLWLDRLGRRFFMLVGVILLTATSAAFVVSASIPLFAILRALHGVAFSTFFVANYIHRVRLRGPRARLRHHVGRAHRAPRSGLRLEPPPPARPGAAARAARSPAAGGREPRLS